MLPKSASSLPEATETHPLRRDPPARARPGDRARRARVDGFVREFLQNLNFDRVSRCRPRVATDRYLALAYTVRDYLMARWLEDQRRQREAQAKGVCYLSAEYLLGRQLDNNLLATGLTDDRRREALAACGIDLDELRQQEVEPGLGNGGLGRLAACFIDSLATMSVPSIGYGIRYEYGIFRQTFVDGQQVEQPDAWLALGSPWEFPHPEAAQTISFGGHTETLRRRRRRRAVRWIPALERAGRALQLHGAGLPERPRQHAAAVERGRDRLVRPARLQLRRLRRGRPRADLRREHLEGALPRGLDAAGQGAAPAAAVLLRRGIHQATSSRSPLPKDFDLDEASRAGHLPAQRHPPRHRGARADARARSTRRAWNGMPRGRSPSSASPTRATRCCPRRSRSGRSSCSAGCCRATSRSSTASTTTSSTRSRERFGDDELRIRDMSIIGEHPVALGAHGVPRHGRRREGQRRRRAALAAAARQGAARLRRVLPGQVHERHQRRHAAALRPAGEPRRSSALITEALGVGLGDRPRAAARARGRTPTTPSSATGSPRSRRANKRRLSEVLRERDGFEVSDGHMLDVMVKRLHEYKRQMLKVLHIVTLVRADRLRARSRHPTFSRARSSSARRPRPATRWPSTSSTSSTRSARSSTTTRASRVD